MMDKAFKATIKSGINQLFLFIFVFFVLVVWFVFLLPMNYRSWCKKGEITYYC